MEFRLAQHQLNLIGRRETDAADTKATSTKTQAQIDAEHLVFAL